MGLEGNQGLTAKDGDCGGMAEVAVQWGCHLGKGELQFVLRQEMGWAVAVGKLAGLGPPSNHTLGSSQTLVGVA